MKPRQDVEHVHLEWNPEKYSDVRCSTCTEMSKGSDSMLCVCTSSTMYASTKIGNLGAPALGWEV